MTTQTLAEGRYELVQKLGEGGMATVYRAIDHRLGVERAIKVLAPNFAGSSKLRERFHREARLMARLEHPNIVTVHDVGQADGATFIVMSLLQHGSLNDHVKRFGPMPPGQATAVIRDVLEALKAAHAIGVVHRDIKPHNVLVDAHGRARLADFGIAHSTRDQTLTRTGALMGTWAYMAPEQRQSAKATDARSDLYAVGAMLLALLRDVEPHDLHNTESHPEQLAGIPENVAAFIRTCTRYRPEERFQSAEDALEALRHLDLPPDPPETPALGTGWIAPGELPPSTQGETNDTLLAWLDSGAESGVQTGPTLAAPDVDPARGPEDADPYAPTAIGAPTVLDSGREAPPAPPPPPAPEPPRPAAAVAAPPPPRSPVPVAMLGALSVGAALVISVVLVVQLVARATPPEPPAPETSVQPIPPPDPVEAPVPEEPVPTTAPAAVQPAPQPEPATAPSPTPPEPAIVTPPPPVPAPPPPPEPAPVEPEPTAAGPTGRVAIISLPEGEVFIDGRSRGRGRVRLDLPTGEHTMRLVRDGFPPVERRFDLGEDATFQFCWEFELGAVCPR